MLRDVRNASHIAAGEPGSGGGVTRRGFVARTIGALLVAYAGRLGGLPLLGATANAGEATEMSAMLGTPQAALGAMQLGS